MIIADRCRCGLFFGERIGSACPEGDIRCLGQVPKRIRVPASSPDDKIELVEDTDGEIWITYDAPPGGFRAGLANAVCVAAGADVVEQLQVLKRAVSTAITELEERAGGKS